MNKSRLKLQLIKHEALRLKPYKDTEGILTIGVGRNLEHRGLTEEEAYHLLDNDIEDSMAECYRAIRGFRELCSARQEVVVNMMFNLGYSRLMGFKKFLRFLYIQDYDKAAEEMLDSKWAGQVGRRAKELAHQMKTGVAL